MLGLIQRVSYATVEVNGDRMGEIGPGILLLLGVQAGDSEGAAARLLHKVLNYRIFPDDGGRMNLNLQQMPERAEALYDYFISRAEQLHPDVASGVFGANMQVSLCNDGPVTFMLEG